MYYTFLFTGFFLLAHCTESDDMAAIGITVWLNLAPGMRYCEGLSTGNIILYARYNLVFMWKTLGPTVIANKCCCLVAASLISANMSSITTDIIQSDIMQSEYVTANLMQSHVVAMGIHVTPNHQEGPTRLQYILEPCR